MTCPCEKVHSCGALEPLAQLQDLVENAPSSLVLHFRHGFFPSHFDLPCRQWSHALVERVLLALVLISKEDIADTMAGA